MGNNIFDFNTENTYKFSPQALTALLITLQRCLAEQEDITELLSDWVLEVKNGELHVTNPPSYKVPGIAPDTEKLE